MSDTGDPAVISPTPHNAGRDNDHSLSPWVVFLLFSVFWVCADDGGTKFKRTFWSGGTLAHMHTQLGLWAQTHTGRVVFSARCGAGFVYTYTRRAQFVCKENSWNLLHANLCLLCKTAPPAARSYNSRNDAAARASEWVRAAKANIIF